MDRIRGAVRRLGVLRDFFAFLRRERLWWALPIALALAAAAALLAAGSSPAVAPFIYTLF